MLMSMILAASLVTQPVPPYRVAPAECVRTVYTPSECYSDIITPDGHEWRVYDDCSEAVWVVFDTRDTVDVTDDIIIGVKPIA